MDILDLVIARFMPPWWLQQRIQLDRLHNQGRAVGLTREQVDEVIYAWIAWYQTTPWPVDMRRIGDALTTRAFGEDWTPPGEGR